MSTELRLALAMRGGVSLAVWIGGAVSEIDLVRRAPGRLARDKPDHDFWVQLMGTSKYERVSVDVLAGASAGGLNGVLYSASQIYDFSYSAMRDIWLDLGSTEGLARRDPPWPSLFMGDEYFLENFHRELDCLARGTGLEENAPRVRIDLMLSSTVIEPVERPLPSPADEELVERRFAAGFRFRQPEERWLPTDFAPAEAASLDASLWRLAIGARSTSSYPAAFEPAAVHSRRRPNFASPGIDGEGRAIDLDGTFLDRTATGLPFVVADGGVLDNIPIGRALDAVATAPADRETERFVMYLQPGAPAQPKTVDTPTPETRRSTLAVLRGAAAARLAGETINDDIAALEAYNERVERANALRRGTLANVDGTQGNNGLIDAARRERESYCRTRAAEEARRVKELLLDPIGEMGGDAFPERAADEPVTDRRWRSPIAEWPHDVREKLHPNHSKRLRADLEKCPLQELLTCTGDPGPLLRVTHLLIEWARYLEQRGAGPTASATKNSFYNIRTFLDVVLDRARRLAWVAVAARTGAKTEGLPDSFVDAAQASLRQLNIVGSGDVGEVITALGSGEPAPLIAAREGVVARIDAAVGAALTSLGVEAVPPGGGPSPDTADLLEASCRSLVSLVGPLASEGKALAAKSAGMQPDGKPEPDAEPGALLNHALCGGVITPEVLGALEVMCLSEFVSGLPGRRPIEFRRLSSANRTPVARHFHALFDAATKEKDGTEKGEKLLWDRDEIDETQQQGIHVNLKLAGNELKNFSAFLLAPWRANDWMWGRLDAVPTLVDLLVQPQDLVERFGDADMREAIHELVAPAASPWFDAFETHIWSAYRTGIEPEIEALAAAGDDAPAVPIPNIRDALVARRQWEILREEYLSAKLAMGSEPDRDPDPSFDTIKAWVSTYRVGAETLRDNPSPDELIERFDEIAYAATETALWNASLPGSPVPPVSGMMQTAVRRAGPRIVRMLAERAMRPATSQGSSWKKWIVGAILVVALVLGVLGGFMHLWAFVIGVGIGLVLLGMVVVFLWWRLRRLLAPSDERERARRVRRAASTEG